ncbi:MAG: N-acetyl-gamma-glutamyl-phosphate reductase [Richelia sp. RM2_1_2]|nr:N-acetyl-gamma-glutamyl-phosphate reductase [Richelia sp. SM1_7_0]NJN09438.1 N-acetyl-gamma-glutamyl-phosphate reductase [Richelia sp. RM1_1_1]NJO29411.1 N-acetyl-gamma-glutamyl-phosphate reductase [Richelia sp. SL_2_1]NJO63727.1 N-acetyl-gamma-glutamyl-phosphate reductase [Richelia sp. RM2_1_2]NJS16397.1 N-acetyl-gamma-glutamyl-phosphate reductase [Nostocaceae cyanobacterium CSU_2_110]
MGKPTVFIDGAEGTTGLQIHSRLNHRHDIEIITIPPEKRKDTQARSQLINSADVAILCLPDDAAREAVNFVTNPKVKILDASSAHRVADGWVYGFPELEQNRREEIKHATRVSNPGCYPTGFLACVRPLIASGIIPKDFPVTINAISGYSGGGKKLIEEYQSISPQQTDAYAYGIYGLTFGHKHVKEMHKHSGLQHPPLFVPAVGNFEKGMLVQIPLPLQALQNQPSGELIHNTLKEYYQNEKYVIVAPLKDDSLRKGKFFDAQAANDTNMVQVFVFANDETKEALLVARLDNLGKGASGAAVQNLNIMLGLDEDLGLG